MKSLLSILLAINLNNQAVKSIEKSELAIAEKQLTQALTENPLSAKVQINFGLLRLIQSQPDEAKKFLESALSFAQSAEEKFLIYFHLGFIAQKANKKSEALAAYQEALSYYNSKEAKTNIELLMRENQQNQQQQQNQDQQNQDQKDQQNKDQQNQDQKDQQNKDQQDKKDQQDPKNDPNKKDQDKKKPPQKKQPKEFKSEELTPGDAKKILNELKQQEQKIRAEYLRQEVKEKPNDKDW